MEKEKTSVSSAPKVKAEKKAKEVLVEKEIELSETEKKVILLEEKINSLTKTLNKLEVDFEKLSQTAINVNKIVKTVDNLFVADLTNRYGFDGEMMYYIGAASSTMYKKPINEEIVDLISRIDTLDWKGIQKINKHFMKTSK